MDLLLARPDVNAREVNGATALALAAGKGHRGIVRALLTGGASVTPGTATVLPH